MNKLKSLIIRTLGGYTENHMIMNNYGMYVGTSKDALGLLEKNVIVADVIQASRMSDGKRKYSRRGLTEHDNSELKKMRNNKCKSPNYEPPENPTKNNDMENKVYVYVVKIGDFPPCAATFSTYKKLLEYEDLIKERKDIKVILITRCTNDIRLEELKDKKEGEK